MKSIRNFLMFLTVVGFLAPGLSLQAQTNNPALTNVVTPSPQQVLSNAIDIQTRRMGILLRLTEEQKPKVKAALQELETRAQNYTPEERQAKRQMIQDEFDARLKEILTPEQFQRWEELRGHRPPRQRPMAPPATATNSIPTNSAAAH
jgi:hypothetical protein